MGSGGVKWQWLAVAVLFLTGCDRSAEPLLPVSDEFFLGQHEVLPETGPYTVHFEDGPSLTARGRGLFRLDDPGAGRIYHFEDPVRALHRATGDVLYAATDVDHWNPESPARLFRSRDRGFHFEQVLEIRGGSILWWSVDSAPDGTLYVGEYGPRDPGFSKTVWRSLDQGESWSIAYQAEPEEGIHIHRVAVDPWSGDVWVTRGDSQQRGIFHSADQGGNWAHARDSQATAVAFTEDAIYWGEDRRREPGITRVDRETGQTVRVFDPREHGNYGGSVYDMSVDRFGNVIAVFMKYLDQDHVASIWAGRDTSWRLVAHLESEAGKGGGRGFVSDPDSEGWMYISGYRFRLEGPIVSEANRKKE